jgi:hypothetical protein
VDTSVVDPREELRPLGGGRRLLHALAPFRAGAGGLRVLLALGGAAGCDLA